MTDRHRLTSTAAPSSSADRDDGRDARRRLLGVAAAVAAVDLASKALAVASLAAGGVDLPGPFDLRLARNRGVAFSIGAGIPASVVIAATAAAVVVLAVAGWRGIFERPAAAGLILGGAAANVLDRLHGGSVVDLFHLGWWPTFNLADVALTIGVAATVLTSGRHDGDVRIKPGGRQR